MLQLHHAILNWAALGVVDLLHCLHLGTSLLTEQRCFAVPRPLSSGAVAVSLAVPPLPQPPVLLPPGWRHSPPSLLLPLPHLPHSLWLLSRLWPQSPGHSLKTIIPPGTRPRLHTGISPYTTVLYKGRQYTHFLWVVLCVWLCTNTTEWLSHTFTVFYRCLQLVLLPWLKESVPRF